MPDQKIRVPAAGETQKSESVWVAIVAKVLYTDTIGNKMQWITEGSQRYGWKIEKHDVCIHNRR